MDHICNYNFDGENFCCTKCPKKISVIFIEDGLNELAMLSHAKKVNSPEEIFDVLKHCMQYMLRKHNRHAMGSDINQEEGHWDNWSGVDDTK